MKFGKRLEKARKPNWVYVNYRFLKKQIKHISTHGGTSGGASGGAGGGSGSGGEGAFVVQNGMSAILLDMFVESLTSDIRAVNDFYLTKEEVYRATFERFLVELQQLLSGSRRISSDDAVVHQFLEFYKKLDDLRQYVVWNYIGVLKVVKKCTKKAGFTGKDNILHMLTQMPFYKSVVLAQTYTEAQYIRDQILYETLGTAPPKTDYSCPICQNVLHEPVVLSCTHRFCWTCIENASRESESCPVCRKDRCIDRTNLEINKALNEFISSTFKDSSKIRPSILPHLIYEGLKTHQVQQTIEILSPRQQGIERRRSMQPTRQESITSVASHTAQPLLPAKRVWSTKEICIDVPGVEFVVRGSPNSLGVCKNWLLFATVLALFFLGLHVSLRALHPVSFEDQYKTLVGQVNKLEQQVKDAQFGGKHQPLVSPQVVLMPDTVFVGHINPDVDSICSAIAAAHFFGAIPARSGPVNTETAYVLNYFGLEAPRSSEDSDFKGKSWCLVDHNSLDKIPKGVDVSNIACVIDHHQLQSDAVEMNMPRPVEIQPWGSCNTIIAYKYFNMMRMYIPRPIAGCMLSGILSDTLNLHSPTTTQADRIAVQILKEHAVIDNVDEFAAKLFEAKSSLASMTARQILMSDYKQFVIDDWKVAIAVVETVRPEAIWSRKNEIIEEITLEKREQGLDYLLFIVVDIINLQSEILITDDSVYVLAIKAYHAVVPQTREEGQILNLNDLVSRKKHFFPLVKKYLKDLNLIQK